MIGLTTISYSRTYFGHPRTLTYFGHPPLPLPAASTTNTSAASAIRGGSRKNACHRFAHVTARFICRAGTALSSRSYNPPESPSSPSGSLRKTLLAWAGLCLAAAAGCGACTSFYYHVVIGSTPYTNRKHRGLMLNRSLEFSEEREQDLEQARAKGQLLPADHELSAKVAHIGGRLASAVAAGLGGGSHRHISRVQWRFHVTAPGAALEGTFPICSFAGSGNVVVLFAAASTVPTDELAGAMALQFAAALAGHRAEQQALRDAPDWLLWDLVGTAYGTVCSALTLCPLAALRGLLSLLTGWYSRLAGACLGLDRILRGPGDQIDHLASALGDPAVKPLLVALRECRRVQVLEADRIAMMLLAAAGYDPECLIKFVGSKYWTLWVEAPVLRGGGGGWFSCTLLGQGGDAQRVRVASQLSPTVWPVSAEERVVAAREHLDSARRHSRLLVARQ